MVWMTMTDQVGDALYLQLSSVEQRVNEDGTVFSVQATVGNGVSETAVLLEIGREVSVTFIDEWLDIVNFRTFINRYDRSQLEQVLRGAVQSLSFWTLSVPGGAGARVLGYECDGHWQSVQDLPRPHQTRLPSIVAEAPPVWQSVA